ncbi:MAG: Thiamine-monophosphate kinase [Cryomorphaceae bacterium]|nr:MAG: Thiamine-monophosphate kinase [Cryomorphaceae bacterium]|tara:strand:+ start:498 stop:1550 length:1053 start_codon:yes stop_codon:yes gene_type:complete
MSLLEDKGINTTPISKLGEFGLIDHLTKNIKVKNASSVKGIGDDAAVIDIGDKYQLISTDLLVEGVHFDLSYMPLKHLGYKSVAVNVSDICAMNGVAKQITLGLAMSNRFTVEALDEFYEGIRLACEHYGVDLVGGDTTSSTSGLMISVTIIGEVEKENVVYRNGAKVNDLVICTGDLGAAYLGLQLLNREKEMFKENPTMQPDLSGNDYVLKRQLKPEAGIKYIEILKDLNIIPTSMIDISDGLSSEILHLAKSSKVGITIHEDKIPIDYTTMNLANEFNMNPITCALSGGEDYELLFTVSQLHYDKFKKDADFTIVGYVTEFSEGNNFIAKDGTSHLLTAQGWDPMKE